MSNNFKPLSEQIATKMAADLRAGTSIFTKPHLEMPYNPGTSNKYKGPTALVLLMQERDDPRWMSLKQASYNKTPVLKGEKGTLINFFKNKDLVPVKGEDGKTTMETVKLDEPKLTNAWLFNAAQLKEMPARVIVPNPLSPAERVQKILDNSQKEAISIAVLIRMEAGENDGSLKEHLKFEIAELLVGADLGATRHTDLDPDFVEEWAQLLDTEPTALFKATAEAQKLADHILAFEKEIGQKKSTDQSATLVKGDLIAYKGTEFKVIAELKNKVFQIQDMNTQHKFKMSSKDNLYNSLLDAKQNPHEKSAAIEKEQEPEYQLER